MLSKYWLDRGQKAMNAVPLQELVAKYQPLVGSGKYYHGIDHDSLVVDPAGFYYWHSQDERGNHISWLKRYEDTVTNYREAVEFLEDWSGTVSSTNPSFIPKKLEPPKPNPDLTMDLVMKYHQALLKNERALEWWKSRGIKRWQIDKWKLGFKPNHWGRGSTGAIPFIEGEMVRTIRHRMWVQGLDSNGKEYPRYVPEISGVGSWVFNADVLDSKPQSILLLEGEIKLMVAYDYGEIGVALSGVTILPAQYIERLCQVRTIYFCPDIGLKISPYEIGWLQKVAPHTDVRIVTLPNKIDDMLLSSSRAWRVLEMAKQQAKSVTREDLEIALSSKKSKIGA